MTDNDGIVVTGVGFEIPGWGDEPILNILDAPVDYGEFNPKNLLGKKGLRYKDRATLMALCAVYKALEDRSLLDVDAEQRANIGICVSSNLGNMDTVCSESEIINKEHVDKTSPMNLPVASSNVIPASIAIRFGFKGINLMLCNGSTSGIDAINISAQMLKSGRAEIMIVVGVEPANEITQRLLSNCDPDNKEVDNRFRQGELAACLVLEKLQSAQDHRIYGVIGDYEFYPPGMSWASLEEMPDVWFIPAQTNQRSQGLVKQAKSNGFAEVPSIDVSKYCGEIYGALGVFQAVVALSYLINNEKKHAFLANGLTYGDGMSTLHLSI